MACPYIERSYCSGSIFLVLKIVPLRFYIPYTEDRTVQVLYSGRDMYLLMKFQYFWSDFNSRATSRPATSAIDPGPKP